MPVLHLLPCRSLLAGDPKRAATHLARHRLQAGSYIPTRPKEISGYRRPGWAANPPTGNRSGDHRSCDAGFALVLTILLLGLLVLATYALGALNRVGADISATGVRQLQARQHALLGLDLAIGELQRLAGGDDVATGMAGVAGVPPGSGHPTRHWCGVWDAAGSLRGWLASGAETAVTPAPPGDDSVALLAEGALGADGTDKEHVRARLVVVPGLTPGASGRYAWWVGDEGVKLSAVLPDTATPVPGGKHASDELIPALSPAAANLSRVETFAQLALVPATPLTPGQLQGNLHALTMTHWRGAIAGLLNVNSSSARFWRGVAATYNRNRGALAPPLVTTAFAEAMRDRVAAADPSVGKLANGPFRDIESFLQGAALADALAAGGGSVDEFAATLRPWLTTRSDTFRVRAYGDALDPADPARIAATAWCEAIVQRSGTLLPGFGRRYVVRDFRWLGPDDI